MTPNRVLFLRLSLGGGWGGGGLFRLHAATAEEDCTAEVRHKNNSATTA